MRYFAVLLFLISFCLASTAATRADFDSYVADNRHLANQGMMKWSDYYQGLYRLMLQVKPLPPSSMFKMVLDLNGRAYELESGKITQEQFDYYRNTAQITAATEEDAETQRKAQQEQQAQAYAQAQANRNAQAVADSIAAGMRAYMESRNREQAIRQQNYDNAVRQQQQYQQQQQNNTYIQQGKCYTDAFAVQRCY